MARKQFECLNCSKDFSKLTSLEELQEVLCSFCGSEFVVEKEQPRQSSAQNAPHQNDRLQPEPAPMRQIPLLHVPLFQPQRTITRTTTIIRNGVPIVITQVETSANPLLPGLFSMPQLFAGDSELERALHVSANQPN